MPMAPEEFLKGPHASDTCQAHNARSTRPDASSLLQRKTQSMSSEMSAEEVQGGVPFAVPCEEHVDLSGDSSWGRAVAINSLTVARRSVSLGRAGEGSSWANAPSA